MSNETKIQFPFYQIKSFGVVIDHTNNEKAAHQLLREASKPAEIWQIYEGGKATLISRASRG
jgi:hypothetical protein